MVERFAAAPDHLYVRLPEGKQAVILQQLKAEMDELWSFVGTKANRKWIWVVLFR
jgi:hypothetical protein